jgi:hypothetical protein
MLASAGGWSAAPARADGDPASDVLAVQSLFLPQDAAVPSMRTAQLEQLLTEAARAGYQIRVALIASAADLGSVTELWQKPQTYAEFLAQELGLVYRGPLLIVMPNGLGFQAPQRPFAPARRLPANIEGLIPGAKLGAAAISAIRQLAAAADHPLPLPNATAQPHSSKSATVTWIAFATGALVIVAAWTASLRTRPLTLRRKPSST